MMLQILVPSYNCRAWIGRCLDSIDIQTMKDYRVLVIDDASTDGEIDIIDRFVNRRHSWETIRNSVNLKCPANLFYGIKQLAPAYDDVVVLIDGDDFLPHEDVFSRLEEVYSDPDVWLTYGNYEPWPHNTGQVKAEPYSREEVIAGDFRSQILFNHLITFRYHLWSRIPEDFLKYEDGSWLDVGYDRAIMLPMMEMAREHIRFLDETLYVYNAINPLSDVHVRLDAAKKVHQILQKRPRMDALTVEEVRLQREISRG